MITILKHGDYTYKKTCPRCGCIFAFWKEDIQCNPEETEQDNGFDVDIDFKYSVECPDCGNRLEVTV